jgi:hypothetical protein
MEQLEVLAFAIRTLENLRLPYMVVGSYGSMAYGEIRSTRNVDIVVDLRMADVPALAAAFKAEPGFYLYESAIAAAVGAGSQFNIIHVTSGNKIDFILPRPDAYGREQLARRQRVWITREVEGYTASPEDIVLGKLWYYSLGESEKHVTDIAAIWKSRSLDVAYIERWAPALSAADAWQALRKRLEG